LLLASIRFSLHFFLSFSALFLSVYFFFFFFQAEDGIRDGHVTGVQTCALPISIDCAHPRNEWHSPHDASAVMTSFMVVRMRRRSVRLLAGRSSLHTPATAFKIGRASCRERV